VQMLPMYPAAPTTRMLTPQGGLAASRVKKETAD